MATRLSYALPIARHLVTTTMRRCRPGGLGAALAPPGEEPLIIVTGSGRSGTSAVARVLHESGVCMGTEFDPAAKLSEFNAVGYYEDIHVRDVNQRIEATLGLADTHASQRWPWRSAALAVAERYRDEMVTLVTRPVGGWKDPRFCVTLEAWLPILPRRPKVVVCLRSPEAYLHSVTRIVGLVRREMVEWWWANNLRRALDVIRDYHLDATCVEYDELVQQPEETVAALSTFVGWPLDAKYVEPELRQFAQRVPPRYARLYQQILALDAREHAPIVADEQREGLLRRIGVGGARGRNGAGSDPVDAYLAAVRAVDERVAAAKAAWVEGTGAPSFKLARPDEHGLTFDEAKKQTRVASEAYVALLHEAQRELDATQPPPAFERYHESTCGAIHLERLVAQLALQSSDGSFSTEERLPLTLLAWERFICPQAAAESAHRREKELARACKRAGYSPAGSRTKE